MKICTPSCHYGRPFDGLLSVAGCLCCRIRIWPCGYLLGVLCCCPHPICIFVRLLLENEVHRQYEADKGGQMVPLQLQFEGEH